MSPDDYQALQEEQRKLTAQLQQLQEFYSFDKLQEMAAKTEEVHREIKAANDYKARRDVWLALLGGAIIPIATILVSQCSDGRKLRGEKEKVAADVYVKVVDKQEDGALLLTTATALRKMLPEETSFADALQELGRKQFDRVPMADAAAQPQVRQALVDTAAKHLAVALKAPVKSPQQQELIAQVQQGAALQQTATGAVAATIAHTSQSVQQAAAAALERQACEALLQGEIHSASQLFAQTDQAYPSFHASSEASQYLAAYARQQRISGQLSPAQLKAVASELVRRYSWKMPADLKQRFQAIAQATLPAPVGGVPKTVPKAEPLLSETVEVQPSATCITRSGVHPKEPRECTIRLHLAAADGAKVDRVEYASDCFALAEIHTNRAEDFAMVYQARKYACPEIKVQVYFVDGSTKRFTISSN